MTHATLNLNGNSYELPVLVGTEGEVGIDISGYPIEELAEKASFEEVSYLLIWGHLPNAQELAEFRHRVTYHSLIHEAMKKLFEDFPITAHPMAGAQQGAQSVVDPPRRS